MLRRITVALSAIVVITGCVERRLTVTSEPEGALAYLNENDHDRYRAVIGRLKGVRGAAKTRRSAIATAWSARGSWRARTANR